MSRSQHENHRTYDPVGDVALSDLALPDLVLPGVTAVGEPAETELTTTYLDSLDLDLLRHGATLQRREGGWDQGDGGWHLVLAPADGVHGADGADGADVSHEPEGWSAVLGLESESVPPELADLVLGLTLGRPLQQVAVLRTHRTTVRLLDAGRLLAEVTDDVVTAGTTAPGAQPQVRSWREWRVVPVDAGPELLDEVEAALVRAGAEATTQPEPLARALGEDAPTPDRPPKRPRAKRPAGRVLHRYLLDQVAALETADLAVRRGAGTGVHDLRVASRRLRGALATWRPLVDREVTDPLREQLDDLADRLSSLRDDEVVHARLAELLESEPSELALGDARRVVAAQAVLAAERGREVALELVRNPAYLALLGSLRALAQAPPWTERAQAPAGEVVRARLAKEVRRVQERVVRVKDHADALGEQDLVLAAAVRAEQLHGVRTAARRLRYAAEAARPVAGAESNRLLAGAKSLQRILGEHHDTVATRAVLVRLGGLRDLHPGTAFSLGRLHAREEQAARELERAGAHRWARLLG